MSLRILVDARMVRRQPSGIAVYTTDLIREWAKLGEKVTILSYSSDTAKIIGPKLLHGEVPCRTPFSNPKEAFELSKTRFFRNFDLIHFPSFSVPALIGKNVFMTVHDLIHLKTSENFLHHIYFQTVFRNALKKCAGVVAISQWTKDDILKNYSLDPEKIHVVRNGLSPIWFSGARVESPQPPRIICISNPKPHKNVKTLIAACQILWKKNLKFNLDLGLGGAAIPSSWNLSPEERKNIRILDSVSDEDLKKLILSAAALVSPSIYEGFDYPIAQALALGTPVLSSKTSAKTEFQSDLLNFYEPYDNAEKLSQLIQHALVAKPRTSTHNVSTSSHMAQATLEFFKSKLT